MRNSAHLVMLWVALAVLATSAAIADDVQPGISANDNRSPAGHYHNGTLDLQLELHAGRWYPENEPGPYRDIYAFSEPGRRPQVSGPLIRVPQGTVIRATVHNMLLVEVWVHGLHSHPGHAGAPLRLAPGERRKLRFFAGEPGTYLYWASSSGKSIKDRAGPETGLAGAFVVDAPGASADDRIFVVGLWVAPEGSHQIAAINGKSWPFTEQLTYRIGEPVHWRVINGSFDPHGMHLHGFFFTLDGEGDGERYRNYSAEQRRRQVTALIDPGHTYDMTWIPDRVGNWLFHCHMLVHMSVPLALHADAVPRAADSDHDHSAGMGGLVVGIHVLPGAVAAPADISLTALAPRKLQLVISENPDKIPLYRLELRDAGAHGDAGAHDGTRLLGPPIVLTRGEATEIEVRNLTSGPTAIHWHGIELDNYYDGVPGWTRSGQQITPAIAPGASFMARMRPPRAGTFIYHTHWHDASQLLNGLYGPLIVLEPGQRYDPVHDKTFVFGVGDYAPFGEMLLINGAAEPLGIQLETGTRYRLRFINITTNESDLRVKLASDEAPTRWQVVAQDGADLPLTQRAPSPADMALTVGSTRDVEYQSDRAGYLEMQVSARLFGALAMQPIMIVTAK